MPPLLSRYVLTEIAKVLAITTAVLVTVIAFGAAIKPLSHDSFLTVRQTLKYIALAIVPMLQFALPFAAGFSATIVFHRLVNDNEVLAMRAGGISYPRILMPVAGLGVGLLIVMVLLTQWIIPNFWELMKRTITTDMTTALYTTIARGRPFHVQGVQIHADEILLGTVSGEDGPSERLHLVGVVAAELDSSGAIRTDVTAAQAVIDLYRRDGRTIVAMRMEDAIAYNHVTGELISWEHYEPRRPLVVPNVFDNDPRFMSRGELLALRDDPDQFDAIRRAREELADQLHSLLLLESIGVPLQQSGIVTFADPSDPRVHYEVEAAAILDGSVTAEAGRSVRISRFEDGAIRRIIESNDVEVIPTASVDLNTSTFDIVIGDCIVQEAGTGGVSNRRSRLSLLGLTADVEPVAEVQGLPSDRLLARVDELGTAQQASLSVAAANLTRRINNLLWEIDARLARRYALSVTALLLLLTGAVLAMQMRNAQLLTVYLLAFLPAVFDILLITSGDQIIRDGYSAGLAVMWSGNLLLGAVLVGAMHKLWRT